MPYTSVFRHPSKGIHRYPFQGKTLEEECNAALEFDGGEHFGELLYCRPVEQMPLQTGRRYEFVIRNGNSLHYRDTEEAIFSQFDYFRIQGPHRDTVQFLVDRPVPVPELGEMAVVRLAFDFRGAIAHKFRDLCGKYEFEVQIDGGQARLAAFSAAFAAAPDLVIPLVKVQSKTAEVWYKVDAPATSLPRRRPRS